MEIRIMRWFQQSQDLASWVVIGITRYFNMIYSMFDGTFFCFTTLGDKVFPNNPSPLGSRVSHKTERGARVSNIYPFGREVHVLTISEEPGFVRLGAKLICYNEGGASLI